MSGRLDGYRAEIGINAWIGNQWLDVGVVTALVPDAKRSRGPSAGQPFLLGRNGFLDRFNVCFDEPNQAIRRQSRRRLDHAPRECGKVCGYGPGEEAPAVPVRHGLRDADEWFVLPMPLLLMMEAPHVRVDRWGSGCGRGRGATTVLGAAAAAAVSTRAKPDAC